MLVSMHRRRLVHPVKFFGKALSRDLRNHRIFTGSRLAETMATNCGVAEEQCSTMEASVGEGNLGNEVVSVIIAVHNAEPYLDECLQSIVNQTYKGKIEVSLHLDACTDGSEGVCKRWVDKLANHDNIEMLMSSSVENMGAGPARNAAIKQSSGEYLCIHDADDVSEPTRIEDQLEACRRFPHSIVGSLFVRIPEDATVRYSRWCNEMSDIDRFHQRFRELTIVQPTWFIKRHVWQRVGGYPSSLAEDLRFFYRHLEWCNANEIPQEEQLFVVKKPLIQYRHLSGSTSSKTPRKFLFNIKAKAIERDVLSKWDSFTIWGAGRDGKDFFKMLSPETQNKVVAMCDIDPKKIKRGYHNKQLKKKIPVVHFSQAKSPIIACVAMDRGGEFEKNLASLNLKEGVDYFHFC
mmetsp:Transcript_13243/g.21567  ORF Transcript_13243/g.21567 Transcript_13243/m.21567 type:complete len:406 (+) Transcript_13243:1108-2325(+)